MKNKYIIFKKIFISRSNFLLFNFKIRIFVGLFLISLLAYNLLNTAPPPRPGISAQQITPAQPILKGLIKVNSEWKNVPEFRIFFDGQQTINDKEGFYSFPIENNTSPRLRIINKNISKFSILICKQLNQNFENINTIKNLSVDPQKPYKFFSFKKTNTTENIWEQREKKLDNKKFVVPKKCMVILMNPKYVEKVENWNIKLGGNFIKLPQIILKDEFKEKQIHRQAAKSILRSFDFTTFHENIGKKTKKDDKKNVEVILASAG